MARGPKHHLKRLNAPKHWMLAKMDGIFAPRPSTGPHKLRECLPVCLILRNRLKYALTNKECMMICLNRNVKVDGKIRTDMNYPAGFMDVVEMPKSGDKFRLLYDTKGRFRLHRISDTEAGYKLCRVERMMVTAGKVPAIGTHDGRTIRYIDPIVKVNDTVKVDINTGKVIDVLKFELGKVAMITRGRNAGRIGIVSAVERHPGSFDIVTVRDSAGHSFNTRLQNIFIIGEAQEDGELNPWVSLPKGKGIKLSILEERSLRNQKN
uniref:40S ribosomal protein S4 n=1 Tax=Phaeomonas parva TaxID=124430 RepID=A0A7S1TQP7_9STRA|mmetsp:Transcript_11569/g.35143  ORF Transcript_11569/g.35143 Transcript_11569/m.35143 type:complete len:265 (+) Transcript_11569:206-1000(+)